MSAPIIRTYSSADAPDDVRWTAFIMEPVSLVDADRKPTGKRSERPLPIFWMARTEEGARGRAADWWQGEQDRKEAAMAAREARAKSRRTAA
ncbi:hypothetical protein [Consotaella aegiceratis]|uniref:hypothetical protein n=1 Tax=Consotaella aegiceratis TaxID=3097961 RepID=UPI002F41D742